MQLHQQAQHDHHIMKPHCHNHTIVVAMAVPCSDEVCIPAKNKDLQSRLKCVMLLMLGNTTKFPHELKSIDCRCLITEEHLIVEPKGFDAHCTNNCANFVFATNWGAEDGGILPIGAC